MAEEKRWNTIRHKPNRETPSGAPLRKFKDRQKYRPTVKHLTDKLISERRQLRWWTDHLRECFKRYPKELAYYQKTRKETYDAGTWNGVKFYGHIMGIRSIKNHVKTILKLKEQIQAVQTQPKESKQ